MKVCDVTSSFTLMYLISEYFLIPKIDMVALGRLFIKCEIIKLMICRKGECENINIKLVGFRKLNLIGVRNCR